MNEKTLDLLTENRFSELKTMLESENPTDLALTLSEFPKNLLPIAFRVLSKEIASQTFVEMDTDTQELLIKSFSDVELKVVFERMFIDDTVDIIEEMPANIVKRILFNTTREKRELINEILKYPENSAGSLMTTEYVRFNKEITVAEAFEKIRKVGPEKETIYTCYVTENDRILVGIVTVRQMLLTDPSNTIESVMDKNIISCVTNDPRDDVYKLIEKYDLIALPVVDKENRLVGIVTFDDVMDAIKERTDDEFMKMAAVSPLEESYFKTSVFAHAKKRLPWLLILLFSATFTGMIITHYEAALSALLVSFIPMIMDTAGNSGSQSSTVVIRGFAIDEIKQKDFLKVLSIEFRIALISGIVLAIGNAVRVWVLNAFFYKGVYGSLAKETIVVGLTLIGAVVSAKTLGCILPMFAKKIKVDPALLASPIITTIADVFSILLYFSLAVKIL